MKPFYSTTHGYCMMDETPIPLGDWVEVPERPDAQHIWDGNSWVGQTGSRIADGYYRILADRGF